MISEIRTYIDSLGSWSRSDKASDAIISDKIAPHNEAAQLYGGALIGESIGPRVLPLLLESPKLALALCEILEVLRDQADSFRCCEEIQTIAENALGPVFDHGVQPYYSDPLHMMEKLGGSFVRALAEAWDRADPENRKILEKSFEKYFRSYRERFREWQLAQGRRAGE